MRAVLLPSEMEEAMEQFLDGAPENVIAQEWALTDELWGIRMFCRPVWEYSNAHDPMYGR